MRTFHHKAFRAVAGLAVVVAATLAAMSFVAPGDGVPPVEARYGWAGPQIAAQAYDQIKSGLPKFEISGDLDDNDVHKRVVLWDAAKRANGGEHLPTFTQAIGDCVGASAGQAVQYLMAVDAAFNANESAWKPLFVPYHYACGRNAPECGNGRMGRDPGGSVGAWQAEAIRLYGVLPQETPGLPTYSAATVQQWAVQMPAAEFLLAGRQHPVRTIARVNTADDIRRAIQNYYVVTIASDWGGLMRPPVVGSKLVNRRAATWNHQMLVIGYDGSGAEPLWYVLNNWGPQAHGTPPDDSPPGGFWIGRRDMQQIASQGDSWAYSDALGFPGRTIDFRVIGK
jgi:hypothetical protein